MNGCAHIVYWLSEATPFPVCMFKARIHYLSV